MSSRLDREISEILANSEHPKNPFRGALRWIDRNSDTLAYIVAVGIAGVVALFPLMGRDKDPSAPLPSNITTPTPFSDTIRSNIEPSLIGTATPIDLR